MKKGDYRITLEVTLDVDKAKSADDAKEKAMEMLEHKVTKNWIGIRSTEIIGLSPFRILIGEKNGADRDISRGDKKKR